MCLLARFVPKTRLMLYTFDLFLCSGDLGPTYPWTSAPAFPPQHVTQSSLLLLTGFLKQPTSSPYPTAIHTGDSLANDQSCLPAASDSFGISCRMVALSLPAGCKKIFFLWVSLLLVLLPVFLSLHLGSLSPLSAYLFVCFCVVTAPFKHGILLVPTFWPSTSLAIDWPAPHLDIKRLPLFSSRRICECKLERKVCFVIESKDCLDCRLGYCA